MLLSMSKAPKKAGGWPVCTSCAICTIIPVICTSLSLALRPGGCVPLLQVTDA
jgi:hypothetical protein